MDWYQMTPDEAVAKLESDNRKGLSQEEAERRLSEHGTNELQEEEKKPLAKKLAEQFLDPMIIILLIAAVISGMVGEAVDSVIILVIVIVNALLSIFQEGKAEEAIAALKK